MDQIKIGRFIAQLRKERNMTQRDLAEQLGITDRAVSKWENGRGLPDLSLIKPLCDALSISINELLSGERLEKEQFTEKAEENIINTLHYSKKSVKRARAVFLSVLAGIIAIVLFLGIAFGIDIHRMQSDLPVVFSTWGFDYAPPINLDEEQITLAIKEHLITQGDAEPKHHEGEKTFATFRTYLIEETEAQTKYTVYAWVLCEKYYMKEGAPLQDSGYSIPHKFEIEKQGDAFKVVGTQSPRDGSLYSEDMKSLFPASVRREMDRLHDDGTYERLQMEIDEQVAFYFHQ